MCACKDSSDPPLISNVIRTKKQQLGSFVTLDFIDVSFAYDTNILTRQLSVTMACLNAYSNRVMSPSHSERNEIFSNCQYIYLL